MASSLIPILPRIIGDYRAFAGEAARSRLSAAASTIAPYAPS